MLHPSQSNQPQLYDVPPPARRINPALRVWLGVGLGLVVLVALGFIGLLTYALSMVHTVPNEHEQMKVMSEASKDVWPRSSVFASSVWDGAPDWIPVPYNDASRVQLGTHFRYLDQALDNFRGSMGQAMLVQMDWVSLGADQDGHQYYLLENTEMKLDLEGRRTSFAHPIVCVVEASAPGLLKHPAFSPGSVVVGVRWLPVKRHLLLKNGLSEWQEYLGKTSGDSPPEFSLGRDDRVITRSGNQPSYRELALQLRELLELDWDEAMPIERD